MQLSSRQLDIIVTLAHSDKPVKRIRNYIENLTPSKEKLIRQVEFFNRMHKAFFLNYFGAFAGRHRDECIMEAYTRALEVLRNGGDFDIALNEGLKAGSTLFKTYAREYTNDILS